MARLELRQALEPWHVLGEESTAGGTVRYVDSSLERIELKVSGLAPDRYVGYLQRARAAVASHGARRRVRRGCALSRLAAVVGAAS